MNPQSPAETFAQVRELLTETEQPLADRAIAAWALTHNQNDRPLAQNFIEESTQLPPTELIGMLPWIGWADIRLAEANGPPAATCQLLAHPCCKDSQLRDRQHATDSSIPAKRGISCILCNH